MYTIAPPRLKYYWLFVTCYSVVVESISLILKRNSVNEASVVSSRDSRAT